MVSSPVMQPRGYQQQILKLTELFVAQQQNVLIELDCGLGKRFLQYSIITESFPSAKILLILQASTSLYETYNYLIEHIEEMDIKYIDSRLPSQARAKILKNHQIVLSLPQTLHNTIKKVPDATLGFDVILINEVDQIVKRMSSKTSLKQPYPKLFPILENKTIIGMSGTLRDNHYVVDDEQLLIKRELKTLVDLLGNTQLLTMDMLVDTDVGDHISESLVIATGIPDDRVSMVSLELEQHIKEAKTTLLDYIKEEDPNLYHDVKNDYTKLFGPLPVPPKIAQNFHRGYLARKYLWSQPGESSYIHLLRYGLDEAYLKSNLPRVPNKFFAIRELVEGSQKTVILCSYLDTVDLLEDMISAIGINSIKVTGQVRQQKRVKDLQLFRESDDQMVAILSNVGERDLDIPEANLLIVFDLIRTTKTVYQKLKRTRGGECRILYYDNTREEDKVMQVLDKIAEKYHWSTKILPSEILSLS